MVVFQQHLALFQPVSGILAFSQPSIILDSSLHIKKNFCARLIDFTCVLVSFISSFLQPINKEESNGISNQGLSSPELL